MPDALSRALNREPWLVMAVDGPEEAGGLAASPWAMPSFFAGWVGIGLVLGLLLARRGHDARLMAALGAGLGPLMALVVSDTIRRREPAADARVLEAGVDHGGPLDVLVLVQGASGDVDDLRSTIESVRSDLGTLTVGRVVTFERADADPGDDEHHIREREVLGDAAARLGVAGTELALLPGRVDTAVERFRSRERRTLILTAVPATSGATPPGAG